MTLSDEQQERRRQDKLWRKRHQSQGRKPGAHDLTWQQIVLVGIAVVATLGFMAWRVRTSLPPLNTPAKHRAHPLDKLVSGIGGLPEVRWVERDDNSIYVGFAKLPDDVRPLIRAWAMQGNAKLDFGVHVWAVEGVGRGWRPGKPGRYITTTARHGTIRE